jgi:hypothetical protein
VIGGLIGLYLGLVGTVGVATAGDVYVNGVRSDGLKGQEFKDVSVRFDTNGDVWIDAPRYRVERQDGAPPPDPAAVPEARYWLVTQDDGSRGHTVDVTVNGELVKKVRSGDKQLILDLRPWLRPGPNAVAFSAVGSPAGGGALQLHVGTGSSQSGTLVLDDPEITFVRRGGAAGSRASSRVFTFDVR